MKEVRKIGRARNLDVVAIREGEATQAGFAPRSRQKLRGGYSLIVSLASLLEGSCIAIIPLGMNDKNEQEYTLVGRTEKGAIHPASDAIYVESQLYQVVVDLKQDLRGNQSTEIPVFGEPDKFSWVTELLDLDTLLKPENISKDFKLKPLRWGMTKPQLAGCAIGLVVMCVAAYFVLEYFEEQERIKNIAMQEVIRKQEEVNKNARYQIALDKLKHPWINSSSIPVLLKGCNASLKKFNISIEGWQLATIKCSQDEISANYNRPDNSAVTYDKFVAAVRKLFDTEPSFNITQTSISEFRIENNLLANGDDPMKNIGEQLLTIISLFQSVNIPLALTEVSIKDVEKNEEGEKLPLQDWREYTFNVETRIPPELIFKKGEYTGMRINNIIYEFGQEQGSVSYKITGVVYGKR
ncbi:type 4b pilus protein PilO2 [Hafnia paralvei]|uniref:type 4b pilus protein PilO2 n=1 Tax=Hafnia paralvei TaxID=546367 RepID=UPI0021E1EE89|nr:type 4b pilus protein PilO2 [Hafnia paralvei]